MARRTVDDLLREARARIARVSPAAAWEAMGGGALLVDVRPESQRSRDGEVPGAVAIGLDVLEWRLDPDSPSRFARVALDRPVIVLCNQGYSSSLAGARLVDLGFTSVADIEGGFEAWVAADLPITAAGEAL